MKKLLLSLFLISLCVVGYAQIDLTTGKSPEEIARLRAILKRMDELRSQMSPAHQMILFEDFSNTGVRFNDISVLAKQDYQKSNADKIAIEKELNFYLSQLGVSYIELSNAVRYEIDDSELMGTLEIDIQYPEKQLVPYYNYLVGALSPFESTEGKPSGLFDEIATATASMYGLFGAGEEQIKEIKDSLNNSFMEIQNREYKTYRFELAKNDHNYRVELSESPIGYSLNLSGLSSLQEYTHTQNINSNPNLQAAVETGSTSLPNKYTIWVKDSSHWYVCVRDGQTAVFLKLALKSNGDMDYKNGTGICFQSGKKYPYTNGSWGKAIALSSSELNSEIDKAQNDYIISPSGNMSSDKVKLNQSSAYFDDLDIYLPE